MHTIRAKITTRTMAAIVLAMAIATLSGVLAIRSIGRASARQTMLLLCEVGQKNLDVYFEGVEHSVQMVSAYASSDLEGIDEEHLAEHLERLRDVFMRMAYRTTGVLTYYYRIDPEISEDLLGFWYVNLNGRGFKEHEVTDITLYDTSSTDSLVWFTVPKVTGKHMWLPPYVTDNLGQRVISYNVPVYFEGTFVGVLGIEIEYSDMAEEINNITLFEHGYAFLTDADGRVVYHPDIDVADLERGEGIMAPSESLQGGAFYSYVLDGVEKTAVWLPLSNGMRIHVTVPVAEVEEGWQRWAKGMFGVSAVVLIVFGFAIMRFADHITKPLGDLTEAATQVSAGNYDVALVYDGDDEVGILTRAFKVLIADLKVYIADLSDRAYMDALTTVRNKGAFTSYLHKIQVQMASGDPVELAICVFDCNGLKSVNDLYGHEKGDIYLTGASQAICAVFRRSPVFRVGGDEFVAVLRGLDYEAREELLARFDEVCAASRHEGAEPWERVDVARGMADFDPAVDHTLSDTLRRADQDMYVNKRTQKAARAAMGT